MWDLDGPLAERRARDLERRARALDAVQGSRARLADGKRVTVFCSNDYLGLASDPRPSNRLASAARGGAGSGGSHLISGHRRAHDRLAAELADFLERDRVLLFSTGYMANLGTIDALVGRGDTVIEDRLNHASLLDGARLAGARLKRYRHADTAALADQLAAARGRRLVVTDGVFSMDGDIAPLAALAAMCRGDDCALMVDDAHGIGVIGPEGRGAVAEAGLDQNDVPVLVGTLGKAFGSFGAFVAGPERVIDYLAQFARPHIYTTAAPAAVAEASRRALTLVRTEAWRRQALMALMERFRARAARRGVPLMPSRTPIQPVPVGAATAALAASRGLEAAGYLVTAIRPPTVPEGTARLRVTLTAVHEPAEVDGLVDALAAEHDRSGPWAA